MFIMDVVRVAIEDNFRRQSDTANFRREAIMKPKYRQSSYNHFVELGNNKKLAFNCMSCALGEMDAITVERFEKMLGTESSELSNEERQLERELVRAGMLVPEQCNEMDKIRALHYRSRFGGNSLAFTILPTLNCNFACDYCYESKSLHSSEAQSVRLISDEICTSLVRFVESTLRPESALGVNWYGGEPLLGKAAIEKLTQEFVRICTEKRARYSASMVTNGYLLDREHIDFLIANHVRNIQVTIDGPKEIHDQRRVLKNGQGSFDRIMDNLEAITDSDPLRVGVRVNVDKRNKDSVRGLLEEFVHRGFHQRENFAINLAQVMELTSSCHDVSDSCMLGQEFADFVSEEYRLAVDMGFKLKHYPTLSLGTCGAVSQNVYLIEPSGNVHACWSTVGQEELKIGTLTDEGMKLNDNYFKWQGWHPYVTENCETCSVFPLCLGGCPYKSLYKPQVMHAEEITCTWWRYNLPQMLVLARDAHERGLLPSSRTRHGVEPAKGGNAVGASEEGHRLDEGSGQA